MAGHEDLGLVGFCYRATQPTRSEIQNGKRIQI